jgi:hypothetical protein
MTRRTFLRLESLEDRMTPAIHVAAPVVQAAAIIHPTGSQAAVVHIPSTFTFQPAISTVIGVSGGGYGGSGGGSAGSGTGDPVGPGPGNS